MFARVAIALIAVVTGAVESTLADERPAGARSVVDDRPVSVRPAEYLPAEDRSTERRGIEPRPLDELGASRLFFTAEERYAVTHGDTAGFSERPAGSTDGVSGGEREPDSAPNRRTGHPARVREPDGATGPDRSGRARADESQSRGIAFQALLHADTRTQVVLDGRLCHATFPANGGATSGMEPLSLRCAEMPAGVRAVQLLRAERWLLVTLSGGDRRRLALGESVTSR